MYTSGETWRDNSSMTDRIAYLAADRGRVFLAAEATLVGFCLPFSDYKTSAVIMIMKTMQL
jgi:hypothetical protein